MPSRAAAPPLSTVELFAGIGGFRVAADAVGLRTLWANDSSERACAVYRDRFGDGEIVEGDVTKHVKSVPAHDILTGGFPCQPFSSAGKKSGIRDARGTLFEVVAKVLERRQPKYFVLENVKRLLTMERGQHFATILQALCAAGYSTEWRLLNAKDFGLAQNRERVVLVGTRVDLLDGGPCPHLASSGELARHYEDPETDVAELRGRKRIAEHGKKFPTWGLAHGRHFIAADHAEFSAAAAPVRLEAVLEGEVDPKFDFTKSTRERLSDNTPVNRIVHGVQILSNQGGGARMGYTIFGTKGLAPTLTATTSRHYERYRIGRRYRRLTNVEYARLQGFPEDHCSAASVYEQYRLFGNAVPPPVVEWVLRQILRKPRRAPKRASRPSSGV